MSDPNQEPVVQDTYVRVATQRYESLVNTERKYQQSLLTIKALETELANTRLLIEALSQAPLPYEKPTPEPPSAATPAKPTLLQPTLLESMLVTSDPSMQNLSGLQTTKAGPSGPTGPVLPGHTVPVEQPEHPYLTDNDSIIIPQLATSGSKPASPNQPVSHISTDEFVKSPIQYKEIFQTCLDLLYGGKPFSEALMLTPRRVNVVMNGLEMGLSRRAACALVGITQQSYQNYRSKGAKDIEPYRTFVDLMEIAEARSETRLVAGWQRHTQDSWQAAQAFLAKRFSQEWGDKRVIELSATQLMEMPSEQLKSIIGEELYNAITQQASQASTAAIIEHDDPSLSEQGDAPAGVEFDTSIGYE